MIAPALAKIRGSSGSARFLSLALAALALAATGTPPPLEQSCRKALAGRRGAIVVVSFPSGRVLHVQNRALASRRYGGTSVLKPLTAYALLREKAADPGERVLSSREVRVERYSVSLRSPYDPETREVDLAAALAESNNGYFFLVGQRLDIASYLRYYRKFGLAPCVRAPATAEEKASLPAHGGGCVSASALELVPYLRALAVDPSPEMQWVRGALQGAVEGGTGQGARVAGVSVCGKTGWFSGVGEFVAFAPRETPEVGLVVALPGQSGSEAAGVAGRFFTAWFSGREKPR